MPGQGVGTRRGQGSGNMGQPASWHPPHVNEETVYAIQCDSLHREVVVGISQGFCTALPSAKEQ